MSNKGEENKKKQSQKEDIAKKIRKEELKRQQELEKIREGKGDGSEIIKKGRPRYEHPDEDD